jgi:hypothetical protein
MTNLDHSLMHVLNKQGKISNVYLCKDTYKEKVENGLGMVQESKC